jgi:acyl-CoA thioesterase-1
MRHNGRRSSEPGHRVPRTIQLAGLALLGLWIAKVVRVGRSVRRYADYWAAPRGEGDGLLYVALGDSAAQGIGASRPDRGYVGILAHRMREQSGRPVQVVNLSRSGARLADLVQEQLPILAGLTPDVVTVGIGGNDVIAYDVERFPALVCDLTAGLPVGAYVADVPYFMHGHWERRAAETGRLLAGCAEENGLRVVRLHDAEQARGSVAMLTDFAADWFHPNDRGHRIWADAFWARLLSDPVLAGLPNSP